MKKMPNKGKKRPIDKTVESTYSQWGKTFTLIKKTKVKTWQGVFLIAFLAGSVSALIWGTALNIQTTSEAEGETAILSLDPVTQDVSTGETFDLDIILNTNDNDVVAVRAIVNYDTSNFSLENWNTDNSVFSSNNTCVYNGKPCEIVSNDTANGIIDITLSKPSGGVNTSSGVIATLTFRALQSVAADNITFNFTAGSYDDSDVILDGIGDDGEGTDILASVINSAITVDMPTCESFSYSDWGACQPGGTQTRTILTRSPEGCVGGNPLTTQECVYVPPTCTSFTYNDWGECQPDSTRSRTVASSFPDGCIGGDPKLTESCNYTGVTTCTSFTYNDWGECQPNNTRSRTVASRSPENCSGGNPILTEACTYVLPACTSFTYSDWGECRPDGTRIRTVISSSPANCDASGAIISEECEYAGENGEEEEIAEEIEVSKPELKISGKKKLSFPKSKKIRSKSKKFSFKGTAEGIEDGIVQVWVDKKLKKEVDIKNNNSWKVKVKAKKNKTYSFRFKYIDGNGNEVYKSGKYHVKVDSKKPKITDLSTFLVKRPGDKIWWKATDNDKVKYYKYYFNGKKKKTKKAAMIIPANTPRGIYTLQVRAYDKAGNKARKYVVVRVR